MECFTAHERTCFELKLLAGCADRATAGKPRFSNIAPRSPRRSPAIAMAETEPLAIFALQEKKKSPLSTGLLELLVGRTRGRCH